MIHTLIGLAVYAVGFIASILALSRYGKNHMNFDYDEPKTYATMDDWSSNAEAFTAWSIAWPIFWFAMFIVAAYDVCTKLTSKLIKLVSVNG